jgi:membrane protein DedA with SNARE-associated domain
MLESITGYVASLSPVWFYTVLALSAFIENVIPPIPGDTVTVFAAYVVGRTQQGFIGVFISTTVGSTAGFMTLYALGRWIPGDYFVRRNFKLLPASNILAAERWFQRHGYWIVLANRFLSGFRSVVSIVCGLYRLPWPRVLGLSLLACAAWNLLLIYAGYLLGANWMAIDRILGDYSRLMLVLAVLLVGAWAVMKRRRARRCPGGETGDRTESRSANGNSL